MLRLATTLAFGATVVSAGLLPHAPPHPPAATAGGQISDQQMADDFLHSLMTQDDSISQHTMLKAPEPPKARPLQHAPTQHTPSGEGSLTLGELLDGLFGASPPPKPKAPPSLPAVHRVPAAPAAAAPRKEGPMDLFQLFDQLLASDSLAPHPEHRSHAASHSSMSGFASPHASVHSMEWFGSEQGVHTRIRWQPMEVAPPPPPVAFLHGDTLFITSGAARSPWSQGIPLPGGRAPASPSFDTRHTEDATFMFMPWGEEAFFGNEQPAQRKPCAHGHHGHHGMHMHPGMRHAHADPAAAPPPVKASDGRLPHTLAGPGTQPEPADTTDVFVGFLIELCFAALLALTLLHLLRVCCLRVYAGPVDDGFDTEDGMATVSFDGDSPSLKGDGCKACDAPPSYTLLTVVPVPVLEEEDLGDGAAPTCLKLEHTPPPTYREVNHTSNPCFEADITDMFEDDVPAPPAYTSLA